MTEPQPNYLAAKDIPDDTFLDAVHQLQQHGITASRWNIEATLAGLPTPRDFQRWPDIPGVPTKVVLAKANTLIRAGKLRGCACGCRGDFTIPTTNGEQPHA